MLRAVNKFKADFGGQVIYLERVQPSSDHVPHRSVFVVIIFFETLLFSIASLITTFSLLQSSIYLIILIVAGGGGVC